MRNLGLDVLRIAAVFLVLGRHIEPTMLSNNFLQVWHVGGWIGVDLFFVLSGFLVSSLLFNEQKKSGQINLKRFLIRRGFKIYPAFWVLILFTIFVRGLSLWNRQVIAELLFIQNYFPRLWNHTWSLAVEEHFYILIVSLFFVWTHKRPQDPFSAIPKVFVITAFSCLILRIATFYIYPTYSNATHLFATHLRIDSLAFGVLLSYYVHFENLEDRLKYIPSLAMLAVGAMMFVPAFLYQSETTWWIPVFGVILFYLGSGLILLASLRLKSSGSSILRFLGVLGAASYSIYLWHMPVNKYGPLILSESLRQNVLLYLLVYFGGSLLVGLGMSRLVEFPILFVRDRFYPSVVPLKQIDSAEDTGENSLVSVESAS